MNVFLNPNTANDYDTYYKTEFGEKVDEIEKQIVADLFNKIPRTKMLELGCGTGHWSAFFIQLGFDVTGIDISEAMLNIARAKNLEATFIPGDAANLPFEDNSFECVSTITMLEFVDDQDKVLHEMKRVLKPNGFLLLGCLNANSILGKNKQYDDTFRDALFLNPDEFKEKLTLFGIPEIKYGVHLTNDFKLVDNTPDKINTEPVFMAALVNNK